MSPPERSEATLLTQITQDFSAGSRLVAGFAGYQPRPEQRRLAREIAHTFDLQCTLIAEAETGTGKTLAYLMPALRFAGKTLISTHTRALQDQLMYRDIPAIQQASGVRRSIALIKGRRNYLCPARLNTWLTSSRLESHHYRPLLRVRDWSERTSTGDLGDLPFDPFEKGIGAMVTATAEQCTGSKCPEFRNCPLMRARQKAQDADIVISNHSLLLADAALKSGEFGEVLPAFDAYVLDEAHSLPDVATQHFGLSLGRLRLISWLNDVQETLDELGDEEELQQAMLEQGRTLLACWGKQSLTAVQEAWQPLHEMMASRRERDENTAQLSARSEQLLADLRFLQQPPDDFVIWEEGEGDTLRYQAAPVEVGELLQQHLWSRPASFVLLSATLRLSDSFAHIRQRLGLPEAAHEASHTSPFDYARQALNYLPRHLPDPRSDAGMRALVDEMEQLLLASRGRAFVLFTSWRSMQSIAPELAVRLPWQVLTQGLDGSRDHILEAFRKDTHSVLCGTRSFWEGVDVPGETLSLVIIEKMPFAPPNDPLLKARIERCEANGGNGFTDIQLPEAMAVLRQGVGRLIRHHNDRGVMAILDSRLYQKRYGREVARNLPPARITASLADVRAFFEAAE